MLDQAETKDFRIKGTTMRGGIRMVGRGNMLTISRLSKSFPGVKALSNVQLDVKAGEIHALVGENGAGKSTLTRITFTCTSQTKA